MRHSIQGNYVTVMLRNVIKFDDCNVPPGHVTSSGARHVTSRSCGLMIKHGTQSVIIYSFETTCQIKTN